MEDILITNRINMKCATTGCRNQRYKHRKLCNACITRNFRKAHPIKASYDILKHNAIRRGKDFELTLEEYEVFVVQTDYIKGKGKKAANLHIDRKDEEKGYSIDNIQILTNSANVKKFLSYFYDHIKGRMEFTTVTTKVGDIDTPF
jgi:hypothetical protein